MRIHGAQSQEASLWWAVFDVAIPDVEICTTRQQGSNLLILSSKTPRIISAHGRFFSFRAL